MPTASTTTRRIALALAVLATGCGHRHGVFHEVPKGLVHVVFTGIAGSPLEELSRREAIDLRDLIAAERERTHLQEGHVAWFFHGFDDEHLYFVVAHWHPGEVVGGTYHVVSRYEVTRSRRAERDLGVADEIAEYEKGVGTLRAGMSLQEVEALRGKPGAVVQLGPVGAFDYIYDDICVRFLEGRAAHLWPPAQCKP